MLARRIYTRGLSQAFGRNYFATKSYTKSHEWVSRKDGIARMGITDYAQRKLGEIAFVELPEVGVQIARDDVLVVLESTKAAGEIMMPVSGEIIEVNSELSDKPELVNSDPEGEGWIVEFKYDLEEENSFSEFLINKKDYERLIKTESDS